MAHSRSAPPKRGYLANVLTVPPLIYPFQYNPTRLTDSKKINWGETRPNPPKKLVEAYKSLFGGDLGELGSAAVGSKAYLVRLLSNGERTMSFKFTVDGREKRPGEPGRRRNREGDIRADLSILRSFVSPQMATLTDLLGAALGNDPDRWADLWFREPPTATLILGSMSMEGFITRLRITETLFNSELDPVQAEVEVEMLEKVDSISFLVDAVKRSVLTHYHTVYEDLHEVLF